MELLQKKICSHIFSRQKSWVLKFIDLVEIRTENFFNFSLQNFVVIEESKNICEIY